MFSTPKILAALLLSLFAFLSTGCGGPKYSKMAIPALRDGDARIIFYRDGSPFAAAIQPEIQLNSQVVGESIPGGFFFVDRAPGHYLASCDSVPQHKSSFNLAPNEIKYIRTSIGMTHPILEIVDPVTALETLKKCRYTGPALSQKY